MNWRQECKYKAQRLEIDRRHKFLDLIWQGKTIGQAADEVGITFDEANGIIMLNLKKHKLITLNRISI
ncbi:MAG: hypothetical protein HY096_09795 [Nitrospinae bacterium]|nr:hypothetical protein [Nitrospinota bacterium]